MTFRSIKASAMFVAAALLCGAAPPPVLAQDRPSADAAAGSGSVAALLKRAESELTELEQATSSIEQSGVVPAETAETFNDVLSAYAQTMNQATLAALNSAKAAADSKGRLGSVQDLAAFEKVAQDHERRTAALRKRLDAIGEQMHGGKIKATAFSSDLRAIIARLNAPIVAPAEAALAVPALAPCIAQNWAACLIAIAKAIPTAVNAWNSYQSCMASPPSVPPKPTAPSHSPWYSYPFRYAQYLAQLAAYSYAVNRRAAYQAWCVATFVAKIA